MTKLYALLGLLCQVLASQASPSTSIARVWDEEILSGIRIDLPNPPVHARNLFHLSVAMYDAWAAYDPTAEGYLYHAKQKAADQSNSRREAISYAAYRILTERYALSKNSATTLASLAARLASLGYDKDNVTLDPATPAGVGNLVASTISAYFLDDGALQTRGYVDLPPAEGGYASVNPPLVTGTRGTLVLDVNRWQPLIITNAVSQNNIPVDAVQKFVGAQWISVRRFALMRDAASQPWIDLGPPPHLGGVGDAAFRSQVVEVIRHSSELTPDDGVTTDISPGALGDNTLGTNDGHGHNSNPVTGQPYSPNIVKRGDFARVLAEFWADGPNSETPPGHWNVLANNASDDPSLVRRIGGSGTILDRLEWDVKLYFVLNAAVHDAACAAWSEKRYYDGWRPIAAVRFMGQLGQSSDPAAPSYHTNGLPLVPGLIEVVTPETANSGGRHAGLQIGKVAIRVWPGPPDSPNTQHSGVRWILASDWMPYQKKTFVTPSFPGYVSGHSAFSRAAAEVLAAFTGSPFFPGGLGTFTAPANSFLSFEQGPSETVQLQWGTYIDAADQAGMSRLWGGIHVAADDFTGRRIGAQCGQGAWNLARQYFDGSILQTPFTLTLQPSGANQCVLHCQTIRGFFYKLQSSLAIDQPYVDDTSEFIQAVDSPLIRPVSLDAPQRFYRLIRASQ